MNRRLLQGLAGLYLVGGVIAFGHAAAWRYKAEQVELAQCRSNPNRVCFDDSTPSAVASGVMAGVLWPLYLSWVAWG